MTRSPATVGCSAAGYPAALPLSHPSPRRWCRGLSRLRCTHDETHQARDRLAAVCAATASPAAAKPTPTGSTAPAQVFFPNPVQTLRNEALTDQKDANYAALWAAYRHVALTDLDGSGTLTGTYAKVESET